MFFFKNPTATEKVDGSVGKVNEVTESLGPQKCTQKCTQKSLELTVASSEVIKAEIRWTLDNVIKGNSNNQNANISALFGAIQNICQNILIKNSKMFFTNR